MISWIQQTFQHHFRTVFAVLLVLVIISFVFVIGNQPGIGGAERQTLTRPFFGINLASQADEMKLVRDAQLSIQLQYGFQAPGGDQLQQFAFMRQASLYLAEQLHVPAPSDAEFREALKKLRIFAGEGGQFDAKRYDDFRRNLRTASGLSEEDVARVVSDDLRIERVQKLIAGPGYALPADILQNLERVDTSWTLVTAKLDRASFQPTLNPSETELAKFFEENSFRYQHPTRLIASYAAFPAAKYAAAVKYTEAELRAFFDADPSRFAPKDQAAKVGEAPAVDFNAVKTQVTQAYVAERASRLALTEADELARVLDDAKVKIDSKQFNDTVAAAQTTVRELPTFSVDAIPAELGGNPQIADEVAKLGADRLISDAVRTEFGAVVLFYKSSLPASPMTLAEARTQALADYRENERAKRFVAAGAAISAVAQAKVKAGQDFGAAVADAAQGQGIKVEVKALAPFTFRQPPRDVEPALFNTLLTIKKGDVSPMVSTADAGYLVFALDRKVPELSEANPNYALIRANYTTAAAQRNMGEYLSELVNTELAKSAVR